MSKIKIQVTSKMVSDFTNLYGRIGARDADAREARLKVGRFIHGFMESGGDVKALCADASASGKVGPFTDGARADLSRWATIYRVFVLSTGRSLSKGAHASEVASIVTNFTRAAEMARRNRADIGAGEAEAILADFPSALASHERARKQGKKGGASDSTILSVPRTLLDRIDALRADDESRVALLESLVSAAESARRTSSDSAAKGIHA